MSAQCLMQPIAHNSQHGIPTKPGVSWHHGAILLLAMEISKNKEDILLLYWPSWLELESNVLPFRAKS